MKIQSIYLSIFLLVLLAFLSGCNKENKENKETNDNKTSKLSFLEKKELKVDVDESLINWTISKANGNYTGTLKVHKGSLLMDKGVISSGQCVIDMNSITISDIKDSIENKKVINILKSKAYFDVEKYPFATFDIRAVLSLRYAAKPTVNSTIKGKLTIKDSTAAMIITGYINAEENKLITKAKLTLGSTFLNIPFKSLKFDKDYGQKSFKDDFDLDMYIVAK